MTFEEVRNICDKMFQAGFPYEDIQKVKDAMNKMVRKKPDGDECCWSCPSCGKEYEMTPLRPNHCENCGQAFDYSNIREWEDIDWDFY